MTPSLSALGNPVDVPGAIHPKYADRILPLATCALPYAGTQSNAAERLREGSSHNVLNMYTLRCNV